MITGLWSIRLLYEHDSPWTEHVLVLTNFETYDQFDFFSHQQIADPCYPTVSDSDPVPYLNDSEGVDSLGE